VVNRSLEDNFHAKGLAFILLKDHAILVERLYMSVNFWVPKRGKEYGRPIKDTSDVGPEQTPLNSKDAKVAGNELWGPIEHPTITDLVQQVNEFFAPELSIRPWIGLISSCIKWIWMARTR
jgi:hypothetical protein